jgi:hypothetical protein
VEKKDSAEMKGRTRAGADVEFKEKAHSRCARLVAARADVSYIALTSNGAGRGKHRVRLAAANEIEEKLRYQQNLYELQKYEGCSQPSHSRCARLVAIRPSVARSALARNGAGRGKHRVRLATARVRRGK